MSQEENKVETPKSQKISQKSVMNYLLVLFAAAFCLLILTLLMEQRTNDEIVDIMSDQITYVQNSHSQISDLHDALSVELAEAQMEIDALRDALETLEADHQAYVAATTEALETADATIDQLETMLSEIQLSQESQPETP